MSLCASHVSYICLLRCVRCVYRTHHTNAVWVHTVETVCDSWLSLLLFCIGGDFACGEFSFQIWLWFCGKKNVSVVDYFSMNQIYICFDNSKMIFLSFILCTKLISTRIVQNITNVSVFIPHFTNRVWRMSVSTSNA